MHKIETELKKMASKEKANFYPNFFKTGPGEYGYGDEFLGVTVPKQRLIAKSHYKQITIPEISELLTSKYHEVRLTALFLLVLCYQKKAKSEKDRLPYVNLYKSKMDRINNWDLVDVTADKILGHYYFDKDKDYLHVLSKSNDLWKTRIGVMSTFYFIRNGQFDDTLQMCELLLNHKHDLIHKATGWMLREIGKRDLTRLRNFLTLHSKAMPRTMLRYAIEKLSDAERKKWLKEKG
ncbi:MAG: DNA alkylation repair protein [Leptospira sp.]|nr:DNA alkylation repair protein [Leptospira sp.]